MGTRILVTLAAAGFALWAASAAVAQETPAPAGAPPTPAAAAPADAPAPETLHGLDAWEQLKGNTIEGKLAGDSFAEYFDPAGSVKYVDKDGLSKGTWAAQKDKVCFDFPEDDDRSCSTFTLTGEAGTVTDDDGSVVRFRLIHGNAKGL